MTTFTLFKPGLIILLLSCLCYNAKAQPRANFAATPVSGCAPLVVNFSDSSTGNPTQWRWDLGNGTVSFLKNPSATYFVPGQYNIKLVVQNAAGIDSIVKNQYITIYAQPEIDFSANIRTGCFPRPVQFTDLSFTNNGTISQWQWDFGDGTFSTERNPNHIYTAGGSYNVSLIVWNSNGCFKSLTKTQYIQIAEGVTADFTNNTPNTCTPPVNITFQNTSIGTGVLTYLWNFGDGSTSTEANPSHNYTNTGSFTVQLITTNITGCKDTIIKPNAVAIGSILSNFTAPDSACVNVATSITNTSTPVPASAVWNFSDGTTSSAISPVKTFTVPGTYTIKLINNFGACLDSITKIIVVSPAPVVSFTTNDTVSCSTPYTVQFTNNSTGAVSYRWFFGDGTTSTLANPSHTYTAPGNYSVRLQCTNAQGCVSSIIKNNLVRIQLPEAFINELPQEGCSPFSWTFNSTINSIEPITSYLWDFGDGTTSTQESPTHVFGPGNFNIRLIVTTASGCRDTVIATRGIKVGTKPEINFSATPRVACANVPVAFTDLTPGNVDQWFWDFGDGSTSTVKNPTHVYQDTGKMDIQLIVWNNGCQDTLLIEEYMYINPPVGAFTASSMCSMPLRRVFTDLSIGADEWLWSFGDGTTSTEPSPVHTWPAPGNYPVVLTVRNSTTGCTYTKEATVRLIDEYVDFTVSDTILCRNTSVNFTAVGSNPGNIGLYRWYFGDGSTGTGVSASHTYTTSGIYDITLIMIDWNGCRDTLIRPQYIRVNGPTAGFSIPTTASCLLSTVAFTDTSRSDGTSPITQWTWNYGDGITENLTSAPFQHTYNTPGIYSVSLTVRDSNGCTDSVRSSTTLTISKPVANFTADATSCPGRNITFQNSSTGTGLTYRWYFGDGTTSINRNPLHAYPTDGFYTVKLVVVDQFGCTDSITKVNFVNIVSPIANFTVSDSVGTCPPLIVNFTNTSQHFTSITWDFGDGNTSTQSNPSHFYNIPGTYYAVLTAKGIGGCITTKQQKIVVSGPYGSFSYDPLTGCRPMTINFTATTHDRVSFVWDFDDGTTVPTNDSIISHSYTRPGKYLPKMILIDIAGCAVAITGSDSVFVHGVDVGFTFTPPTSCTPSMVQFTNTSFSDDQMTSFQWNFGDGSTSTERNPSHLYTTAGFFYPTLKVTTAYGCTDSLRSIGAVKIVATPQAQFTQTANGCTPVTINFVGSLVVADTSALTWNWDFGNGNTSTLAQPPAQIFTTGTYPVTLKVTNSSGCVDTVITSVQAFPLPVVNAGADTTICQGTGRTITATGAATYSWSPSTGLSCADCPNPVATPGSATMYVVQGTSEHGCTNKDSVMVRVKYPFAMTNSKNDTLCVGTSLNLFASGAHAYSWSPSAGLSSTTSANPVATPTVTTRYQVIGTDDMRCFSDTGYVNLRVFNIPTVEAGDDKTINVGESIDLVPKISSDVTRVIWNPTGSIFRSDYPSITVKPRQTTEYKVEVINGGGCTASDRVSVYVICNGANVFIPNTFSPNEDGSNDVFYPRGRGLFSIKSARIFNRWGEVVYEKSNFMPNDASAGWNGTFKGQKLTTDVYVYVIEIMCDNNTVLTYKGNIALVR